MQNSTSMRNMYLPLLEIVLIIVLYVLVISVDTQKISKNHFEGDTYTLIKSAIIKWWRKNNVTKPIECKQQKFNYSYDETEFSKLLSLSEIQSVPCYSRATPTRYYFKGQFREGLLEGDLEGKGKVVFISNKEWSTLSPSDAKRKKVMAMSQLNICFKARDSQEREIREVIGTFKNGSLHGRAKVTYKDNSFYIGNYKNGKAQGYGRTFDSENNLLDAGEYHSGLKAGYHWSYRFGHLLYEEREIFTDKVSIALAFAINPDGSLADPIAGDYFPYTYSMTNVSKVHLINTHSSKSHCMQDIAYQLSSTENYAYSLSTKNKYPVFGQKDNHVLCNRTKIRETGNMAEKLKAWIDYLTDLLEDRSIHPGIGVSRAPEILWQLRPELEQLYVAKSNMLISDVNICSEKKSMTARILGSPPVTFVFANGHVRLNNNMKLNGFNHIQIDSEQQQHVPKEKTLGWGIISIAGKFSHGVLNGLTLIKTNVSTEVWATVKNGILHGPCVVYGISYIIDPVRFIFKLYLTRYNFHSISISFMTI